MNWHERRAAAIARGYFTLDDKTAAEKWPTCACGEQDPRIPRSGSGCPKDIVLFNLGCNFADAVWQSNFVKTAELLGRIEARAAQLIG